MKFIVIAIAFLVSSAYAAKVDLPRPAEADCCDGEASTNEVFAVGSMSGNWFCVMLENAALTNNTVAVEFGKDADGDGALSCDEVGVSLGWMCGKMFLKDCASNLAVARDLGSGQHKLEWRFRLIPGRLGSHWLDHSLCGANVWDKVLDGLQDEVFISELEPPWSDGEGYTWPVPNYWRVIGDATQGKCFCNTDQRFELDGNGTARIKKFGFVFECDTNRYCTVWREE